MNILLSNDDGIHARGIRVLHEALEGLGNLHIVAPSEEQSAVGHAITIFDPIKMQQVKQNGSLLGYAVSGTPADCVKLAVCELLDPQPDFVISGINLGPNTGISVLYSGTVSAATEGTILGIPSMALSLNTFADPEWEMAARVARQLAERFVQTELPPGTLLNVNIPNRPFDQLQGVRVTRMARSRFVEKFDQRNDPRGNIYYWLEGEMEMLEEPSGTDVEAVEAGYVSVTPIGLDLTRHDLMPALRDWETP